MSKKLDDEEQSEPFDQFKGRKSDYNWELYSTKLPPESAMTREQVAKADTLEKELGRVEVVDPDAKEELLFSAVSRTPQKDRRENLQSTLMQALAAQEKTASGKKPLASDPRSRTNSLRTGETSKVIKTVDLECSAMEKDDYQEYIRFCEVQQQIVDTKSRKMSSDFFKEESKRIEQKMQRLKPKKRFTCFNQNVTDDIATVFESDALVPSNQITTLF